VRMRAFHQSVLWLLLGDLLTLAAVTLAGFASHHTLGTMGFRFFSTWLPLAVGWILIAPHLGMYDLAQVKQPGHLWRPVWAMLLAAPMAAWLRGVWLQQPILPVFVAVIGCISALSLLTWRGLYILLERHVRRTHG
jgi:hypothetical protein